MDYRIEYGGTAFLHGYRRDENPYKKGTRQYNDWNSSYDSQEFYEQESLKPCNRAKELIQKAYTTNVFTYDQIDILRELIDLIFEDR